MPRRDPELLRKWKADPPTQREQEAVAKLGAMDYEVYSHKLELACWEGREILTRMGVSPMIEGGDVAVGIYTAQGDLGVSVPGTHLHLINGQIGVKFIMKYWFNEPTVGVKPGDIFYLNDPLYGGIHNPDQICAVPVFHGDELIAWVACMSHQPETGAKEPGGNPPSAESRYDEGMRLPPIKVGENYLLKADLMEMMENFVRDSRMQALDTRARVAVCHTVERRIRDLAEAKGPDLVIGVLRKTIEETAEAARRRVQSMTDGVYRAPVFMDCVGAGKYGLLWCMVEVDKRGDRATVRFWGSPRVVQGNFNIPPHTQVAMTACFFYQFLFWDLLPSIGCFHPFDFEFQPGSFFDPDPDDAVSLDAMTFAHVNAGTHTAFEKALFTGEWRDYVVASWAGSSCTIAIAGVLPSGLQFVGWDQGGPNGFGMGGKCNSDGIDAAGFIYCAVTEFVDSETVSNNYPVLPVTRNRYLRDGTGFGKYRGGRALAVGYMVRGVPQLICMAMGGHSFIPPAQGLFGGYTHPPLAAVFLKNTNSQELAAHGYRPGSLHEVLEKVQGDLLVKHNNSGMEILQEGDIYVNIAAGAPGYGDSLERDPELVMKDLREDSISDWVIKNIYRVAYNPASYKVDVEETRRLRAEARQERLRRGKPFDEFMKEWAQLKPPDSVLNWFGEWPPQAIAHCAVK